MDDFQVNRDFEKAIGVYTNAPLVVLVSSCTAALTLALGWQVVMGESKVEIPRKTYCSVPSAARHVGLSVEFIDVVWNGVYQILDTPVWDCAKRFTGGMYVRGQVQCVSFHRYKPFNTGMRNPYMRLVHKYAMWQGGAILHDDPEADAWYRRARFDGRAEGMSPANDAFYFPNWHCYMSPPDAARGLRWIKKLPRFIPDQEMHDYPDLKERWHE